MSLATGTLDAYRWARTAPAPLSDSDKERFWSYVRKGGEDECWPWRTGKLGMFWWRNADGEREHEISPRVAYRLTHGNIPPNRVVGHTCDNRPCCNPKHLECVTQKRNAQDMADRGLHPYLSSEVYAETREGWWRVGANKPGEGNGNAHLSDELVAQIRQRYGGGGIRQVDLAVEFGVGQSTISRVVRRSSWVAPTVCLVSPG